MKSVLVFNHINDIVFVHNDASFKKNVNEQAVDQNLICIEEVDGPLNHNAIVQLYSPLVASQRYMLELKQDPYQTITLEDGTIYVFEMLQDYICLAINGDGDEAEEILHRKLLVLQRIIGFFVGPVRDLLCNPSLEEKKRLWNLISSTLECWMQLYASEQCFLIEAIERLQLNEVLNSKCVSLLESAMSSLDRASLTINCKHSFLLIQSQLVALYSVEKSTELQIAELLMMILFNRTIFPSDQTPEEILTQSYQQPTTYYKQKGLVKPKNKPLDNGNDSAEEAVDFMYQSINLCLDQSLQRDYYKCHSVFLETTRAKYTPYILHAMHIMDNINMLVLCEVRDSHIAGLICKSLSILRTLLMPNKHKPSEIHLLCDLIDNNFKELQKKSKNIKGRSIEIMGQILTRWQSCKKLFLMMQDTELEVNQLARLESSLNNVHRTLKMLFQTLYCTGKDLQESRLLLPYFDKIRNRLQRELMSYKDYFIVRSQRNLSMASYVKSYPGLVHFLYVDRTNHLLLAPPIIDVNLEMEQQKLDNKKEKLWKILPYLQSKLRDGYLTQIHRDDQYCYSYYLWFEDSTGPVICRDGFLGCPHNIRPGLLAGQFYRQVLRQCFQLSSTGSLKCFELVCMHETAIADEAILKHSRQLITALCEETWQGGSTVKLL